MFFNERPADQGQSSDGDGQYQQDEASQFEESDYIQLIQCLEGVTEISHQSQQFYVEVIRNLAEYIIFSEQNKRTYFDLFCEKNMMEHFTRILNLNYRNVNIQLIQTTSIFLQNISQETKRCKYFPMLLDSLSI